MRQTDKLNETGSFFMHSVGRCYFGEMTLRNEKRSGTLEDLMNGSEKERIKAMSVHEKVVGADPELLKKAYIKTVQEWDSDEFKDDILKNLENETMESLNRTATRFSYSTVDFCEFDLEEVEEEIYQTRL